MNHEKVHMDKINYEAIEKQVNDGELTIRDDIYLLQQYKVAVDESNIVTKTDTKGTITYVNEKFEEISGYRSSELIGKNHNIIRHPDMPKAAFKNLWDTITQKKTWHGTVKNRKKDGTFYFVEATIIPILNSSGDIEEYIAIRKDVTRLLEARRQINKQTTDQLTGLSNHIKFEADYPGTESRTILLLNIDMFREITDFYGIEIGNSLLVEVAERCKAYLSLNSEYTLYKLREGEFLFAKKGLSRALDLESEIFKICDFVMSSGVHAVDGVEIFFSMSCGSYYGQDFYSINKAQVALQFAKETRRLYYVYDDILKYRHEHNLKAVGMLKQAIALNKIMPYYQPIINTETGKVEKFESLVRLIDSNDTVKLPGSFLEIAKKSRLYPQLTRIIVEKVLDLASKFDYEFSINLSIEDMIDPKIKQMLISSIKNFKGKKENIIFEITESENIQEFDSIQKFVSVMKKMGCRFAIDDFGTGYSNFEYLAQLQVDFVKIDGSLIKQITKSENIFKIVQLIVDFAKEMNFKTVAEYIDCKKTLVMVKEMGIDYAQGYYLGEPLDELVSEPLAEHSPKK